MADGGGEVSVGDLVVHLRGRGDAFMATFTSAMGLIDRLDASITRLGQHVSRMESMTGGAARGFQNLGQVGASAMQKVGAAAQQSVQSLLILPREIQEAVNAARTAEAAVRQNNARRPMFLGSSEAAGGIRPLDFYSNDVERTAREQAERRKKIAEDQQPTFDAMNRSLDNERQRAANQRSNREKAQNVVLPKHDQIKAMAEALETETERNQRWRQNRIDRQEKRQQRYDDMAQYDVVHGLSGGSGGGGGKMMLARRLAFHGGQALGVSGAGNEITAAMLLGEVGGGAAVAAGAGVIAVAATVTTIVERWKELRAITQQWKNDLRDSIHHSQDLAASTVSVTNAGEAAFQAFVQRRDSALSKSDEFWKEHNAKGFASTIGDTAAFIGENLTNGFNPDKTSGIEKWSQHFKEQRFLIDESRHALERYHAELEVQAGRKIETLALGVHRAEIGAMPNGLLKQESEASLETLTRQTETAHKYLDLLEQIEGNKQAALRASQERGEDEETQLERTQTFRVQAAMVDKEWLSVAVANSKIAEAQQTAIAREEAERRRQIYFETQESRISIAKTGYDREVALTREQSGKQYSDAARGGASAETLAAIQEAGNQKLNALAANRNRSLSETEFGMTDRTLSALHEVPPSLIAWSAEERRLNRELGVKGFLLDEIRQKFMEMSEAVANEPLVMGIRQANIELERQKRLITEVEAQQRSLRLAHPEADGTKIAELAQIQALNKSIEFRRSEMGKFFPQIGLREYALQLKENMAAGGVSDKDALFLLRQKFGETVGRRIDSGRFGVGAPEGMATTEALSFLFSKVNEPIGRFVDTGQFNSKYAAGQVDIRALDMNRPIFKLEEKADEGNSLLLSIDTKLGVIAEKESLY